MTSLAVTMPAPSKDGSSVGIVRSVVSLSSVRSRVNKDRGIKVTSSVSSDISNRG